MAILLGFFRTLLFRNIRASQALLEVTNRLKALSFTLVADFPWLLLTVLSVAVFLGLLGTSFHFQLANLLWLKMAVLLFDRERMSHSIYGRQFYTLRPGPEKKKIVPI